MLYDCNMEQKRPILITSEDVSKLPVLIVDKKGVIGAALASALREQFLIVVVTAHILEKHDNVIHIPYHKKIPIIPDNTYSHIFVVYNGEKELLDMLSAFEEKAEAVKARFLFITTLLYSTRALFDRIKRSECKLMQTVLVGETFDNNITEANEINYFIHQVRVYGRIEVPKEGLGILYPIFFEDMLTAIIALAFAVERPKEIIYLFPHHNYDEITLARTMQKIDPLMKVDFSKKQSVSRNFYIPPHGLYFYRDYNLEERLRKIDFSRIGHRSKLPQKKIQLKVPHPEEQQSKLKLIGAIFAAVFIAPPVVVLLCALLGAGLLTLSVKQAEAGSFVTAQTSAKIARNAFSSAQIFSQGLLLPQLLVPDLKRQFVGMMHTGSTIASTESSFIQAIQSMVAIYQGKSLSPGTDFFHAQVALKSALITVQKLEAEKALPPSAMQKLNAFNGIISLVEETIDTWPAIAGIDGKKTYLILFQNNMELRPGGGFIGSYGIVSVNKGRIENFHINDVYDADGHLTKHIQPPYGLQRYLGVSHWFLRDSNFDPDFTVDAKQAAYFLQLETGQKVDGVIAIDTTFLKNLLEQTGPVFLPDYKVTVNSANFYLLTETHAEKHFFPGSTQKKDFLRSLMNALVNKFALEKKMPYVKLAQLLVRSIQQKDVLFAFANQQIQNVFTVNDLSSSLWDGRVANQNTVFDYFGVVDANVGSNKANYYIKRSLSQETTMDASGGLQTTAQATYVNTSTTTSPFGGDYKDYVRFLIPANASLESVAIDNRQVKITPAITDPAVFTASGYVPPSALEVDQTEEQGKKLVGFFFIVPAGTTREVSITYSVPGNLNANTVASTYSLHLFKQPGAGNDSYQLSLVFPQSDTVVTKDRKFTNVGGKLIYDGKLSGDKTITASFAKK